MMAVNVRAPLFLIRPLMHDRLPATQSCTCETENMNKVNLRLASIASLGGLLFGYETAVISGAIKHLTAYFSLNSTEVCWAVSSALAGCMVKALPGGYIINALRRKKALIIAAVLILASAIGTALPPNFTTFWIFRSIGGLGVGLASLTVPVYISES
ncbi:MFS transporter [Salmonella enterica subsp. enterica]|nr:MFS transporter [Salmonella enterica subsp. enterica]ECJ4938860.1 MFS transporter [Salmonella enterica subsp. enterica]EDU0380350.1 sugar porter family MFS transporter [Salmonella enterica subsp. enterica]